MAGWSLVLAGWSREVCDVRPQALKRSVLGPGTWNLDLEPGTLDLEPGTWDLGPGTWDLGFGTWTWDSIWDLGLRTWAL